MKIGKIKMSKEFILDVNKLCPKVLKSIKVIKNLIHENDSDSVEYLAISDHFDDVEEHYIPYYIVKITKTIPDEDGKFDFEYVWEKKSI